MPEKAHRENQRDGLEREADAGSRPEKGDCVPGVLVGLLEAGGRRWQRSRPTGGVEDGKADGEQADGHEQCAGPGPPAQQRDGADDAERRDEKERAREVSLQRHALLPLREELAHIVGDEIGSRRRHARRRVRVAEPGRGGRVSEDEERAQAGEAGEEQPQDDQDGHEDRAGVGAGEARRAGLASPIVPMKLKLSDRASRRSRRG